MPENGNQKPDLGQAMLKDRFRLKKMQAAADGDPQKTKAFQQLLSQSVMHAGQRLKLRPLLSYPEELPVSQKRHDIANAIADNQLVIVAGETGSGKTTQLGKICLELGRGRYAMIGHTQPRRVAASSVANRLAEEMSLNLGDEVGYQIRFKELVSDNTLIKLMTDGVLLSEIQHDRFLEKYDTLIIDEAHERSLNIDFLLGYIKQLLPRRKDLKVIITSATIDVERFSKHFSGAPVITVSGRSYPVETVYRPVQDLSEEQDLPEAVLAVIEEIQSLEASRPVEERLGDVLVFLPGESDIRQTSLLLRRAGLPATEVLPLYARLGNRDQQKIFNINQRKAGRRIVLATNIAETSITVPGISYVIDSGLARISRYSHRSKVQRLPIEKVSRASAEQRAGRCGRTGPGICFRLYDEQDYLNRDEYTLPEIQRTNLASVILQMQVMRLGNMQGFPFLDVPDKRLVNDGTRQLQELAALDQRKKLTSLGKKLSRFPVDPKFARMLLQASRESALTEVLIIVAALATQDPRESPADKREAATQMHARFKHTESDFIGLLNLWTYVEEQRQALSNNQFRKMCQKEFLSWQRLREWRDTHKQLLQLCREMKLKLNKDKPAYDAIHRAILSGLLTQVGFQGEKKLFDGCRNRQFRVFPASYLASKPPKWMMAAELLETSQLYAHQVAAIQPQWIEELGSHLLKFHYSEPHWSQKRGQVMAYQKSSLYGLPINEKKRIAYGKIDPGAARQVFIQSALVEEQLDSKAAFFKHNQSVRKTLLDIEEKTRRRDIVVSDESVYRFYDERIPAGIVDRVSLEKWLEKEERKNPGYLFADASVFQASALDDFDQASFPDRITWKEVDYKLSYRFEPGHPGDGITVRVPVEVLNRVPHFRFEWLVPGILPEKCEAMLKLLPKQYRRQLVPIPDTVKKLLPAILARYQQDVDERLALALGDIIKQKMGMTIPADAWQEEKLDSYYRMNIQLMGEKNKTLEFSRDLGKLVKKHAHRVKKAIDQRVHGKGETVRYQRWEFDDLEQNLAFRQSGAQVRSYPAIRDEGDSVSLTLADYPHTQKNIHRKGLVRLAMLSLPQETRYLRKELLRGNELQLKMTAEYKPDELMEDLLFCIFNHAFFRKHLPFSKNEFEQCLKTGKSSLVTMAQDIEQQLRQIVDDDYAIQSSLRDLGNKQIKDFENIKKDIEQQRRALVYPGFLFATPVDRLADLPRYFRALALRLERLQGNLPKDVRYTEELLALTERYNELVKNQPGAAHLSSMQDYRWMIEEYRISLFAQPMKTRFPVSKKRIEKQWQRVLEEKQSTFLL